MTCPLVMIEWEDSRQPVAAWTRLSDFEAPTPVQCVSVGWLIHDGKRVKVLAPNMGDVDSDGNVQASGLIQIPTRCVVRQSRLKEPIRRSTT